MPDKFSELAARLIKKRGRTITLCRMSRTPQDAAKPWRGSERYLIHTRLVSAVEIEFKEEEYDGTVIRRGDKRFLVAADEGLENLFSVFDSVLDGEFVQGQEDQFPVFSIVGVSTVQPGETKIMYQFHVRA